MSSGSASAAASASASAAPASAAPSIATSPAALAPANPDIAAGQLLGASATPKPSAAVAATTAPNPAAVTTVPILMYHYIRELPPNTPDQLGYGLSIAPALFEQQLNYLSSAGYTSISMDDLTSHIVHGSVLPPKPIVLSFDDGYADFYSAALPALLRHHFTATTYLVVDFLGRPGYMSWQQALELKADGMEIGAHTMDHVDLSIQSLAQAQHQIDDSRTILQQRLAAPVDTFAYPSGAYNATTLKVVAADGFTSAVTTQPGDHHTAKNLLTLQRVRVYGGITMPAFIASVAE